MEYTRQDVSKYILQALRDLGGQAHSKKLVQRMIDREDGVSSEEVYFEKVSKNLVRVIIRFVLTTILG